MIYTGHIVHRQYTTVCVSRLTKRALVCYVYAISSCDHGNLCIQQYRTGRQAEAAMLHDNYSAHDAACEHCQLPNDHLSVQWPASAKTNIKFHQCHLYTMTHRAINRSLSVTLLLM